MRSTEIPGIIKDRMSIVLSEIVGMMNRQKNSEKKTLEKEGKKEI
jgi:hypothetical protein